MTTQNLFIALEEFHEQEEIQFPEMPTPLPLALESLEGLTALHRLSLEVFDNNLSTAGTALVLFGALESIDKDATMPDLKGKINTSTPEGQKVLNALAMEGIFDSIKEWFRKSKENRQNHLAETAKYVKETQALLKTLLVETKKAMERINVSEKTESDEVILDGVTAHFTTNGRFPRDLAQVVSNGFEQINQDKEQLRQHLVALSRIVSQIAAKASIESDEAFEKTYVEVAKLIPGAWISHYFKPGELHNYFGEYYAMLPTNKSEYTKATDPLEWLGTFIPTRPIFEVNRGQGKNYKYSQSFSKTEVLQMAKQCVTQLELLLDKGLSEYVAVCNEYDNEVYNAQVWLYCLEKGQDLYTNKPIYNGLEKYRNFVKEDIQAPAIAYTRLADQAYFPLYSMEKDLARYVAQLIQRIAKGF